MLIKRIQGYYEVQNGYYYEYDAHATPLGEGGMGVVYKGYKVYDSLGTRSEVAIKAMYEDLPIEVYRRAEREASIQIRNESLIEMLGFVSTEEDDPFGKPRNKFYVISEYLHGVTLSDMLSGNVKDKEGREIPFVKQLYSEYLSDREKASVKILKSILSGIQSLHDKGFIHRDIDPTNIMVTDKGNIKLIDFGIAKSVSSLGTIDKMVTSSGVFLGKAEYAAPELILGAVGDQGYHTDIYAVGILFYQLLTSVLPFTGSRYEVMQHQLNDKIPNKRIANNTYAKIIKKACKKKASDRYVSVAEMRVSIDNGSRYRHNANVFFICGLLLCIVMLVFVLRGRKNQNESNLNEVVAQGDSTTESVSILRLKTNELFEVAVEKLYSSDKTIAQEGLSLMKEYIRKGDNRARYELGRIYCDDRIQSDCLKNRRAILGLENHDEINDLSILYLEALCDTEFEDSEILYMLGYHYWRNKDWKKAQDVLDRANAKISQYEETECGYTKDDLNRRISKLRRLCMEQLDK